MRRADRLREKADQLESKGLEQLSQLAEQDRDQYNLFRRSVAHVIMGLGGDSDIDTDRPNCRPWHNHRPTDHRGAGRRHATGSVQP